MSSMHNDFSDTHPWVPKGCDQQGRYPQAAEAATDVGQDDPLPMRKNDLMRIAAVAMVGILAWTLLSRWLH
jgi:hypothetical protein